MTKSVHCPFCSMRLYTPACPRCGAAYQGGEWRSSIKMDSYRNNISAVHINKDTNALNPNESSRLR